MYIDAFGINYLQRLICHKTKLNQKPQLSCAHLYFQIRDNFLVPEIENWLGDDEIILQDDNASCHWAKRIKAFLQKKKKSMA